MTNNDLPKALRNAAVLSWLVSLPSLARKAICIQYAAHLRCPVDEVVADMTYPEDIEWLFWTYRDSINSHVSASM